MNELYEVMNPWADVDPMPLRGIAPRAADLKDKKVGLFALTYKGGSRPTLAVVEEQLKEKFPTLKFSWFEHPFNLVIADMDRTIESYSITPEFKAKFEKWVKEVDAVVTAVGD